MTSALRTARALFAAALVLTLVCLLAPSDLVLAAKLWAVSWLPFAVALDAASPSGYADKLVHAGLFALQGFFSLRGWPGRGARQGWFVALLGLGAATEWAQSWIPGRGASVADWTADALGLCLGVALALALSPRGRSARRLGCQG